MWWPVSDGPPGANIHTIICCLASWHRALKVWQIFGTNARSKLALLTNELHFSLCLATTLPSVFRYLASHDYGYLPVVCCQMSLPLALLVCIAPPASEMALF